MAQAVANVWGFPEPPLSDRLIFFLIYFPLPGPGAASGLLGEGCAGSLLATTTWMPGPFEAAGGGLGPRGPEISAQGTQPATCGVSPRSHCVCGCS